jgi:hypothetical protein
MAGNTYFEYHGTFPDAHTREHHALRFLEHYMTKIESTDYSGSYLPYYHPDAIFHDAQGVDYVGGEAIWKQFMRQFSLMSKLTLHGQHIFLVSKPDGTHTIFSEWLTQFWLNGREDPVKIPRSMVFKIGKAEGEGDVVGFEGLQILDVRLYYDRSLLVSHLKQSAQEKK